jgi:hypothetical protein
MICGYDLMLPYHLLKRYLLWLITFMWYRNLSAGEIRSDIFFITTFYELSFE